MKQLLMVTGLLVSSSAFAGSGGTLTYGPVGTSVPALSGGMLVVLAILMAVIGYRMIKQKTNGGTMAAMILSAGVLASAMAGVKLMGDAYAVSVDIDLSQPSGGIVKLSGTQLNSLMNTSGVPLEILDINIIGSCFNFPNGIGFETQECAVGLVLKPGETENLCVIDCD